MGSLKTAFFIQSVGYPHKLLHISKTDDTFEP